MIFEPNAEPGFTNQRARKNFQAHRHRLRTFRQSPRNKSHRYRLPGARRVFRHCSRAACEKPFRLLVTGGSQGALAINRTFVDAMDRLAARKSELSIVHQTGERDYNAVRTAYARREYAAEVVPFLTNMAERFAWADVIVCRAGAITAAEIAAAGPRRHLYSFRRRHRQPSIAQRAGDGRAPEPAA